MSFSNDLAEFAFLSGVSSLVLTAAADSYIRAQRGRFSTSFLLKSSVRSRRESKWPIIFGLVITLEMAAALLLTFRHSAGSGLAIVLGLVPPMALAYARTTPHSILRLPLPKHRNFRGRPVPQTQIAQDVIDSVSLWYTCLALAVVVGALLMSQHNPRRAMFFQWLPTTAILSPAATVGALLLMMIAVYHVLLTILEGVGQIEFEMYRSTASFRSRLVKLRWLWWLVLAALAVALLIVRTAVSPNAQGWMSAAALAALVAAHPFWNRAWTIRPVEGGNVPLRLELLIGGTLRVLTVPAVFVFYVTTVMSHHPIRAAAVTVGVTIPFVMLIRRLPSWRPGKRLGAAMLGVSVLTPLLSAPTLTGVAGAAAMIAGFALGFIAMTVDVEQGSDDRFRPAVLVTVAFAATTALILLPVARGPIDAVAVLSLVAVMDLSVIYGGWLRRHAGAFDFD